MMTMSLKDRFEEARDFNDNLIGYIKNNIDYSLGEGSMNKIIHFVNTENYLQILFSYGIQVLRVILDHFEKEEDYEKCSLIRDTVTNHNKAAGTNYKLK